MKIYHIIILLVVVIGTNLEITAQNNANTEGRNDSILTQEYLDEIERIMVEKEKQKEAERVLVKFEADMMKDEQKFKLGESASLMRGIALTIADRDFKNMPGVFKKSDYDMRDYAIAMSPLAASWALKFAGVESRSKTKRMFFSNALAVGISSGITLSIKRMADENRPDGSDSHSMPSGHSSIAFVSATILHREYGHVSPWISVGGYATATGTQLLRLRHNRHWAQDLFVGAGIGITSTNLAYFIVDKIFGEKEINQPRITVGDMIRLMDFNVRPTSVALTSGSEIGKKRIDADCFELTGNYNGNVSLSTSSTFSAGVEGSLFLTENFGIDAIGRLSTTKAKAHLTGTSASEMPDLYGCNINLYHFDLGGRYSLPFGMTNRFSARAFAGVRITEEAEIGYTEEYINKTGTNTFNSSNTFLRIPGDTDFEIGAGIAYDYISTNKYVAGFSFDYIHTFSPLMRNRCRISTVWKIIL